MSDSTADAVKTTSKGEWIGSLDGDMQAKLSLGESARGHHYALETASYNSESEHVSWSKAYASRDQAEAAGQAHRLRALGDATSPAEERAWQKESAAFAESRQPVRQQQTAYWGNVAATPGASTATGVARTTEGTTSKPRLGM